MKLSTRFPLLALIACSATASGLFLTSSASVSQSSQPTSLLVVAPLAPLAPVAAPPAPKKKFATPLVSCCGSTETTITLGVCAGVSGPNIVGGAPAGFTIQWTALPDVNEDNVIDAADCAAFVWPSSWTSCDDYFKASFSGMAACSVYSLAPGQCTPCNPDVVGSVEIGDLFDDECGVGLECPNEELTCGTTYVFRAFAHANSSANRSEFTANFCCTTTDCPGGGCMLSQGFWRNKVCNNASGCLIPPTLPTLPACACAGDNSAVNGLCLIGGNCYDAAAICTLLNTSFGGPGDANKLGRLAHQVAAVELSYLLSGCGGGIPGPDGNGGIGDSLAAAHVALVVGDAASATTLTTVLSTFIEDNHVDVEPGCP